MMQPFLSLFLLILLFGANTALHDGGYQLKTDASQTLTRFDVLSGGRRLGKLSRQATAFPDGIWTSQSDGYTIDATGNASIKIYDETLISCVPNPDIEASIGTVTMNEDGTELEFKLDDSMNLHVYNWSDNFQAGCLNGPTLTIDDDGYQRDALLIFDILVQTFSEHYANFELRDVDWQTITAEARLGLSSNSTDEQLIEAIVSVLVPLKDPIFGADDLGFYYYANYSVDERMAKEFEGQSDFTDLETYEDAQLEEWLNIVTSYLDNSDFMVGNVSDFLGANTTLDIAWGTASDGKIGYLNLFFMQSEDPDSYLSNVGEAILDLKETKVMIIDARLSYGYYDWFSLTFPSHFTEETYMPMTKKAVDGDGYTPPSELFVNPTTDPELRYDGKIILITSELTNVVLATAMAQLPQVTLLGQNTDGSFADLLYKVLPNRWYFLVSNEVYLTPNGDWYEGTGVPPDIAVETELLPLSEREAGVDSWMELALKTAQQMIDAENRTGTSPPDNGDGNGENGSGGPPNRVQNVMVTMASAAFVISSLSVAFLW